MGRLLMATLAVRLDFAAALVEAPPRCRRVAEILMLPCFRDLERVSAHRGDHWIQHATKSADAIAAILGEPMNSGVAFETKRGKELVASAEIKTREVHEGATRFSGYLAFPAPADIEPTIAALCELAAVLEVGAGFVAAEPSYALAQRVALGGFDQTPRPGLSRRQMIERRGSERHFRRRHNELAGPEWGTFLGPEHLARLDLDKVRMTGAFNRVVAVSQRLAYLQVTPDPADDLKDAFDARLEAAREALAPILMDLTDISID